MKEEIPVNADVYVLVYSFWHSRLPSGTLAYAKTLPGLHRAREWYKAKYPDLQDEGWVIYGRMFDTMRMPNLDTFAPIPG